MISSGVINSSFTNNLPLSLTLFPFLYLLGTILFTNSLILSGTTPSFQKSVKNPFFVKVLKK